MIGIAATWPRAAHAVLRAVPCLVGCALAVQALMNGRLSTYTSGPLAGTVSGAVGSAWLGCIVLAVSVQGATHTPATLASEPVSAPPTPVLGTTSGSVEDTGRGQGWARRASRAALDYSGGTLGAVVVMCAAAAAAALGLSLYFVTAIASQLCTCAVLEHWAVLGAKHQRMTWQRAAAVCLGVCGAVVASLSSLSDSSISNSTMAVFIPMAIGVGCLMPLQAVVNKRLAGRWRGRTLPAVSISFVSNTAASAFIACVWHAARGEAAWTELLAGHAAPWWTWLGGFLGVLFVGAAVVVPPRLGLTYFFLGSLVGQLAASAVLDAVLQAPAGNALLLRCIGMALVLAAAVLDRVRIRWTRLELDISDGQVGSSDSGSAVSSCVDVEVVEGLALQSMQPK